MMALSSSETAADRDAWGPAGAAQVDLLLVDDRTSNLLVLESILGPLGHRLTPVTSGKQALARAEETDFAVILLDVRMEEMDGFETAAHLKRGRNARTPIIFLTAEDESVAPPAKGYAQGAVDFLTKPLQPQILTSKVRVFVELFLARRRLEAQALLLAKREREAVNAAQLAAGYIARLRDITLAFSEAGDAAEMADVVLSKALPAIGATAGSFALLNETADALRVIATSGLDGQAPETTLLSMTRSIPLTDAVRNRGPIFLETKERFVELYPHLLDAQKEWKGATAALPLISKKAVLGGITLVFAGGKQFTEDELSFFSALIQTCAQALVRVRLQDQERRAHAAALLLAEVSKELSSSLEYEGTLARVAQLMVPLFADWCVVDVVDGEGVSHRLGVEAAEPAKMHLVSELQRSREEPSGTRGLAEVLRSGVSEFAAEIPEAALLASAHDEDELRLLRALEPQSYMIVPLRAGARVLGAITLVRGKNGTRYSRADVTFMEDVGVRAGFAMENARLFREVSELNASLEQRVQERTRELAESNPELESFSYSVSHDLRAPLRHITGFAQLLEKRSKDTLDEAGLRFVRTISDAAQQGGRLVDDLLAFSRMGRADLKKKRVDLARLIEDVRVDVESEAQGRNIDWRIDPGLPVVFADAAMLRLALRNLLSNAVKYTRPRSEAVIEITARAHGDDTEIIVKDNGVGFQMQYVDKLFGVFQRLHTSEQFEGTGIGLANVRRIIQRHGGRTWAESVVDQGATFHLTLPPGPAAGEEA